MSAPYHSLIRRRTLLHRGLAGIGALLPYGAPAQEAPVRRNEGKGPMRITEIEVHEILLPFHEHNAVTISRYHGLGVQLRTIYVVRTDTGLEGLGDSWGRGPTRADLERYVGASPFDWLQDTGPLPMNMACYDLMGKHLGVPAWKLIGPRVRAWVPVGYWTVSQAPDAMAEEVRQAVRRGYRWLKYHLDEVQNVLAQTEAMQKVAPPWFRVHFDLNANSHYEAVAPVLRELEKFPIAGRVEDPISAEDRDGWRLIRERSRLPIIVHHGPLDLLVERRCDGAIAGHAPIGHAMKVAAVAEQMNLPFMLQQCGGTINQAFLAHEAAVFRMATLDHFSLAHLWSDDVVTERMPVVSGAVRVPTGPGLGVALDREKLARYARTPRPEPQRFLVRSRYADGLTVYCRHNADRPGATDNLRYIARLHGDGAPGPRPGYANPIVTDFWAEPGDAGFDRLWRDTEAGPVWTSRADSPRPGG